MTQRGTTKTKKTIQAYINKQVKNKLKQTEQIKISIQKEEHKHNKYTIQAQIKEQVKVQVHKHS